MNIHSIFSLISPYFRKRRMRLFYQEIKPALSDRVLDVGGSVWGWIEKPDQKTEDSMVAEIVLLKKREFSELFPKIKILSEKFLGILTKSYTATNQ